MPYPRLTDALLVPDRLDVCEHANVIVVESSAAAHATGARPVWLGLANDRNSTKDIAAWVQVGGTGLASCPGMPNLCSPRPGGRGERERWPGSESPSRTEVRTGVTSQNGFAEDTRVVEGVLFYTQREH